ncbi:MAG: SCP2 sterol-binding domain-containing protein [Cardiobacteriaceae bacterium]|nr:SCP2 sterol-binding domain-containing protein [Cardiobacteriaceae bacterium]
MVGTIRLPLLAEVILQAINQAIKLDPEAQAKLEPLNGKTIAIKLDSWEKTWVVKVEQSALCWVTIDEDATDVALSGNLGGYLGLLSAYERRADDRLRIQGDVHDAQILQSALRSLKPDMREACVLRLGDARGEQMYRLLAQLYHQGQSAFHAVKHQLEQWQQEIWVTHHEYAELEKTIGLMLQRLGSLEKQMKGGLS